VSEFTWVDGERLIRFGAGAISEAPELIAERGMGSYALLTTARAASAAPAVVDGAAAVIEVPAGRVDEVAAAIRAEVAELARGGTGSGPGGGGRAAALGSASGGGGAVPALVALGGGRVIDVAKALAAADGHACAALPTTLAGSPVTGSHRLPAGVEGVAPVRPSLVVWDPDLIATLPRPQLAATALNALAHALESLYTPRANPVGELAALRAAELIGGELPRAEPDRAAVALGAVLGGYAVGASGFAFHHAICQTVVRSAGTPHAETNAVVLPHSAAFAARRAPGPVARFAAALGGAPADPADSAAVADAVGQRIAALTARTGVAGLAALGVAADGVPRLAAAVLAHPALASTAGGPPSENDVAAILAAAL